MKSTVKRSFEVFVPDMANLKYLPGLIQPPFAASHSAMGSAEGQWVWGQIHLASISLSHSSCLKKKE